VLVHGCNAQGEMGSGAAWAVRQRLPFAYDAYRSVYHKRVAVGDELHLGEVIWAIHCGQGPTLIVGNAITQRYYGSRGVFVDYESIRAAIHNVDRFVQWLSDAEVHISGLAPVTTVGMPMIGAGRGGGMWSRIAEIIEAESRHFTPVVYHLPEAPFSTGD
jgi:O-acetyl-ADP-ribose deacetylase (regulator of RNase III)